MSLTSRLGMTVGHKDRTSGHYSIAEAGSRLYYNVASLGDACIYVVLLHQSPCTQLHADLWTMASKSTPPGNLSSHLTLITSKTHNGY